MNPGADEADHRKTNDYTSQYASGNPAGHWGNGYLRHMAPVPPQEVVENEEAGHGAQLNRPEYSRSSLHEEEVVEAHVLAGSQYHGGRVTNQCTGSLEVAGYGYPYQEDNRVGAVPPAYLQCDGGHYHNSGHIVHEYGYHAGKTADKHGRPAVVPAHGYYPGGQVRGHPGIYQYLGGEKYA